jgi:uncharacterized caspase-like protein
VFFSTHGMNDASRNLILFPSDINVQDETSIRYSGVRYAELKETLSRLADRGKTLVFLDACHAGSVLPGAKAPISPDMVKVANDLGSAESGVVVFSASTGKEYSYENPDYRHGNLTEALLEAFDGKSDRPPPWLHVSDLDIWVRERVKTLSNGTQAPVVTVPYERLTNPVIYRIATSQ